MNAGSSHEEVPSHDLLTRFQAISWEQKFSLDCNNNKVEAQLTPEDIEQQHEPGNSTVIGMEVDILQFEL